MSVPKQLTNQKIPKAGQALQLLLTVASWHGNCFIWRQPTVLFDKDRYSLNNFHTWGPLFVITTYLAILLSCRFICTHLYANDQCHSQWLNPRVCTSLWSSCLLPVFSPTRKNWKNPCKETKICSGSSSLAQFRVCSTHLKTSTLHLSHPHTQENVPSRNGLWLREGEGKKKVISHWFQRECIIKRFPPKVNLRNTNTN